MARGAFPDGEPLGFGRSATMRKDSRSDTDTFGARNFAMAKLGDQRRTRRLVALADRMVHHPGSTLPQKLQAPADLTALYRLCERPEVTHETVLAPHIHRFADFA
jgi:hypothetical protein